MGTIKSSREIDRIFRESQRISTPLLVALITKTPEGRGQDGRVAFIAGKRLGPAVWRNRARRVMRETARRNGAPWAGLDVALIARRGTTTAAPSELDHSMRRILTKAGVR